MITRIRIEGEADSSERIHQEFQLVRTALEELFAKWGVAAFPAHEVVEHCNGDPDVVVEGNWKGRAVVHFDTQKLNEQIPPPIEFTITNQTFLEYSGGFSTTT